MALRWIAVLVVAMFLGTTGTADAQAFKPRGKTAPAKTAKKASTKKSAKAPAKKKSKKRAAQSEARSDDDDEKPEKASKSTRERDPEDADDYVVITDDE